MKIRIHVSRRGTAAAVLLAAALMTLPSGAFAQPPKLLLTQVEVRGDTWEYVVVKNPGASAVDLSHVYLTDATFANGDQYYYHLPNPALLIGGGDFNDFVARFPDGATLAPGAEISVGINGNEDFLVQFGKNPHYELYEDGSSPDGVPDMVEAREGSLVGNLTRLPGFSNSGEVAILFYWDGVSDLVTDLDYVVWGDKEESVDKTGIAIDGPDAGSETTAYLPDTPIASQEAASFGAPTGTFVRTDANEGTQAASGGNGVGGRNETSENLTGTFTVQEGIPPGDVPVDTTAPAILAASGDGGSSHVLVTFSETVAAGASTASNYQVALAAGGGEIMVTGASVDGAMEVTLALASPLASATSYRVTVSNVQDVAGNVIVQGANKTFASSSPSAFQVTGAFQFGKRYVGVAFSDPVNAAQAVTLGNYSFTPPLTLASARVQENGQTVILQTAADLPQGNAYALNVSNVTSMTGGNALASGGPFNFTTVAEAVTDIATIQMNHVDGEMVTIVGQIYIPATARGGTPSAYLQDGSGRGMNLFGGDLQPVTNDRGSVVAVTGSVLAFFTTIELENYTATQLAEDQPPLGARRVTIAEGNSSQWEGTYIEAVGTVDQVVTQGVGGAINYIVSEGASQLTFRVDNDLGIPAASVGETVTARGAGGAFQTTFQIVVGNTEDFFEGGGGGDTTPPTLVSASGDGGSSQVRVTFNESVGTGANVAGNYTVTPTAGGAALPVTAAAPSGSAVTLTLGQALANATGYTVRVSNVADAAGNVIVANSSIAFTSTAPSQFMATGAFQFGRNFVGIGFSDRVNASAATNPANYSFSPPLTVSAVRLQDNQQTVIFETSSSLPASTSYMVTVSNVTSATGQSLPSGGPFSFQTVSQTIMNISDVQTNASSLVGQNVNVLGQVYITAGARAGTPSAYIQDGSGRGVNLFGGTLIPAVNALGNVVQASGTVTIFSNTVVELMPYTATLVTQGQPHLGARRVTIAEGNSSQWEGTYIESMGTIDQVVTTGVGGAVNYIVSEGGASQFTFRVDTDLGIPLASVGESVTARGAGGAFQTTFQILIGSTDDFIVGGGGGDTTPPTLVSASGDGGSSQVRVSFNEPVGTGANVAANYSVTPTAGGAALPVTAAAPSGSTVTLTLGQALANATGYTVRVSNVADAAGNVIVANSSIAFTSTAPGAFMVTGAFQFGRNFVGIGFSDRVNSSAATNPANFSFSPPLTVSAVRLQDNQQIVIFETSASLPTSTSYMVTVSNVTSATGQSLPSGGPFSFQTASQAITNISDVQMNSGELTGQEVNVVGQVYITATARGSTPSSYIQDGSGRGLNLFGGSLIPAVNALGNVVRASGTVTLFFTTVELMPYTATLVAGGQPHLGARVLSVAEANSPLWEGTYIEVTAAIQQIIVQASAVNYNVGTGATVLTFRVDNDLGINANDYQVGETVTGRGAGAQFQTTFQINIGSQEDFVKPGGACDTDTTPPFLRSASRGTGDRDIAVAFSEPVDLTAAQITGNYQVTADGAAVGVERATLEGSVVTLRLDSAVEAGKTYEVTVSNVPDLCGNVIAAGSKVSFQAEEGKASTARLTVPARTLIRNLETMEIRIEGEDGTDATCRIFDLQGRLVRVLLDQSPLPLQNPVVTWDGRDDTFELVRAGTYIVHLKTTQLSGEVTQDQAPIVVSVRLD